VTVEYVVLHTRINVRAKPDSTSTWVRFATKNEVLQVVKVANGWAQLLDGTYVYAGYLEPKASSLPTPAPVPAPLPTPAAVPTTATVDYVVLHTRINVRARPESNSTWKRFAVKDELLHVVKIENGWAQLADGTYVFAGYIRKV
jgi:uncharacterized protein YgiM (DUF1202 family)